MKKYLIAFITTFLIYFPVKAQKEVYLPKLTDSISYKDNSKGISLSTTNYFSTVTGQP